MTVATLLRLALADLEGIMPEFEPGGDRTHPAWTTIDDLQSALEHNERFEDIVIWKSNDRAPAAEPFGHCDTCGAICDANGCPADRSHVVALSGVPAGWSSVDTSHDEPGDRFDGLG